MVSVSALGQQQQLRLTQTPVQFASRQTQPGKRQGAQPVPLHAHKAMVRFGTATAATTGDCTGQDLVYEGPTTVTNLTAKSVSLPGGHQLSVEGQLKVDEPVKAGHVVLKPSSMVDGSFAGVSSLTLQGASGFSIPDVTGQVSGFGKGPENKPVRVILEGGSHGKMPAVSRDSRLSELWVQGGATIQPDLRLEAAHITVTDATVSGFLKLQGLPDALVTSRHETQELKLAQARVLSNVDARVSNPQHSITGRLTLENTQVGQQIDGREDVCNQSLKGNEVRAEHSALNARSVQASDTLVLRHTQTHPDTLLQSGHRLHVIDSTRVGNLLLDGGQYNQTDTQEFGAGEAVIQRSHVGDITLRQCESKRGTTYQVTLDDQSHANTIGYTNGQNKSVFHWNKDRIAVTLKGQSQAQSITVPLADQGTDIHIAAGSVVHGDIVVETHPDKTLSAVNRARVMIDKGAIVHGEIKGHVQVFDERTA